MCSEIFDMGFLHSMIPPLHYELEPELDNLKEDYLYRPALGHSDWFGRSVWQAVGRGSIDFPVPPPHSCVLLL